MSRIGFTGTQSGMTELQQETLRDFLRGHIGDFHHGDCKGADDQAHSIAVAAGLEIYIHPPINPAKRAFRVTHISRMRQKKVYLDRNKDIVLETDMLIATPAEPTEQLRSGTWSTVRFARKHKKPVVLILPDGTINTPANSPPSDRHARS